MHFMSKSANVRAPGQPLIKKIAKIKMLIKLNFI